MKVFLIIIFGLLSGCGVQNKKLDLEAYNAHKPRSIVVVPVLNESTEVTAPQVFSSTVTRPLAERGFYVFPLYLTDLILKDFGLSEAGHIHQLPPKRLNELFGADAVLYVTIKDWSSKYLVLSSSVVVAMEYVLKDAKTGTVLWKDEKQIVHNSGGGGGGGIAGLIIMAASAALNAVATDYRPLARQANFDVFKTSSTLPTGPYHPDYGKEQIH